MVVVEVTDPANPEVVATLETPTRTHTVSCSSTSCPFAYSDGRSQGAMSIIDLRDFREPKVAGTYQSVVPQGHDEDLDDEGILWHVGGQGAVALDISEPTDPVPLNSTNEAGLESDDREGSPYNNFILHNSLRPNAKSFQEFAEPSLAGHRGGHRRGFVRTRVGLLPDVEHPAPGCSALRRAESRSRAGAWKHRPDRHVVSGGRGRGCELLRSLLRLPRRRIRSTGLDEYGTRILDVRDPSDIKQVGYFFTPASETWAAYWVPARNDKGVANGRQTNIVYTTDVGRGVDILDVGLPTDRKPRDSQPVRAPVLPASLQALPPNLSQPSKDWGFVCRVPQR